MLKNLTFLAVAGLLGSGCIITTGTTDSDSSTESTTGNTTGNTTTATTEGTGSTTGGTGSATGSSGEPVTTTSPTTGNTTTATEGSSGGSSGGSSMYGMCGWNADLKYYGCDGMAGASDPDGISPIDCPAELPMVGDKCDETTPVNNVGCCLMDGTNYYCDADGMVQMDACG